MKGKHKHNWQYKGEQSIPIKIIEPSLTQKIVMIPLPDVFLQPIVFYDYYNIFVCECGKEKEVKKK